jgi:TolA-binding protein
LAYYKTVVEKLPLSGYAEDALIAIESIYQTRNEPEEYLAYIENIGKGATKTADEREVMRFNAAEQIFLSENYQKALVSLEGYHEKYPDGKFAYKADFYMAESYKSLGMKEQACDSYRKVISDGEGSFVELSILNFANISYSLERWEEAYGGYSSLYSSALLENNTFVALTGMLRSAYRGRDWANAIQKADMLMEDQRSDEDLKVEAKYVKAKSYLATSRRDAAMEILNELAADPKTEYGAEAAYLLIVDCYDRGEFEEVENKVYAFADSGSEQTYWLAKGFVILGDSFVERGELKQARATFESVVEGYSPQRNDDDVISSIEMRLTKLEEIENKDI